jgi:predicted enzyme related to lactoylglutathione lyase
MGRVVSFELSSQDPERAATFYSSVFGWEIADPNWGYHPVTTGGNDKPGINGGISKGGSDFPHGTRIQIEVVDIDEALNKSVKLGAQIVRDKMEFDDFYLAYLVDPVGNGIGLIQNKNK